MELKAKQKKEPHIKTIDFSVAYRAVLTKPLMSKCIVFQEMEKTLFFLND